MIDPWQEVRKKMFLIGTIIPFTLWAFVLYFQFQPDQRVGRHSATALYMVEHQIMTAHIVLTCVGIFLIAIGRFYIEMRMIAIVFVLINFFMLRMYIDNHSAMFV